MKKTAIVTGATSGIGKAIARKLISIGHRVIITGRSQEKLESLKNELGENVFILCFDVRDKEATLKALTTLPKEWQEVDILVNNAGLALGLEPEFEGNFSDWDTMIDTNIKGLLTMTRYIVPDMIKRGKGQIINIGSVAGDAAYANGSVYCATKAAVKTITDGLRIDVAGTPLRVTLLKPGLVETNFSNVRFHGDTKRAASVYKGICPLTGEDIAEAAIFAIQAPAHVQIAEMLILATHQANGSTIIRNQK